MLIHDGDCAPCSRLAERATAALPMGIPVVPYQSIDDLGALGLTRDDVVGELWWVSIDGHTHRGLDAIVQLVVATRQWWSPLARLALVPPLSWLARPVHSLTWKRAHRTT